MLTLRNSIRIFLNSSQKLKYLRYSNNNPTNQLYNANNNYNINNYINTRNWYCTNSGIKPLEENDPADDKNITPEKHFIGQLEGKLMIKFTCKKCSTRNSKTMTKLAYEKGVVIIRCDGCKNNHLIADNLGWFGHDLRKMNIEKIMKLKGETVKRLHDYSDRQFEAIAVDKIT